MSGNKGQATPSGGDPIFDNKDGRRLTKLFPNNTDLEDYDDKIGGPEGYAASGLPRERSSGFDSGSLPEVVELFSM